ncbi:MAG: M23 family peptidase [Alphaproteobacteria bacterium]|nr:M23 family peptidase [Alphaproteobacteria bacterium]
MAGAVAAAIGIAVVAGGVTGAGKVAGFIRDFDAERDVLATVRALTEWEAATGLSPFVPVTRTVVVARGDNLMELLVRAGAGRGEAHAAIGSLSGVYDPRRNLSIGDRITLTFGAAAPGGEGDPALQLARLDLPLAWDRKVAVRQTRDGRYWAEALAVPLDRRVERATGTITSSFYESGAAAGLSPQLLNQLIRLYSFDVDFQREIQEGDSFAALYERWYDKAGAAVRDGDVVYARLTLGGSELPLYRYETGAGTLDWFNTKGESVRKALMRTPIDGARLSSTFGPRRHPVLGFTHQHAGVDFAAPSGTPIYAAGDGRIVMASSKGGYGNYVLLRHNTNWDTAYAHMKGFARGIHQGGRVRQGDIIGYVGTTGMSTGPHLHYEVHRDGKPINPLSVKMPSGEKLAGKELERFRRHVAAIDHLYEQAGSSLLMAKTCDDTAPLEEGSAAPAGGEKGC